MSLNQVSLIELSPKTYIFELPALVNGRCNAFKPFNFNIGTSQILGYSIKTQGGIITNAPRLVSIGPENGLNPTTSYPHIFIQGEVNDTSSYILHWVNCYPTPNIITEYSILPPPLIPIS